MDDGFRKVPGTEDLYAHESGSLVGFNLVTNKWHVLKLQTSASGYKHFKYRQKAWRVNRAVLLAHGGAQTGPQCRHKNGVRDDNRACNLEWGTNQDNVNDRERHGTTARHAAHGMAKVSMEQVLEIRARVARGENQARVAKDYGLTQGHVSAIHNRRTWRHI